MNNLTQSIDEFLPLLLNVVFQRFWWEKTIGIYLSSSNVLKSLDHLGSELFSLIG